MKTGNVSKIITLTTATIFALAGSGCKSVCDSNKKTGYATIVCQPADVQLGDGKEEVQLKVAATGCGLNYRWYRYDQPLDEADEKRGLVDGVYENKLTILGDWKTNAATYYCVIGSKNSLGEDVQTQTRVVYYTYYPSTHIMSASTTTPTQNLPKPGAPQTYPNTTFRYCSVAPIFRNVSPPAGSPAPTTCAVTLMMIDPPNTPGSGTPVPPANYFLKVLDSKNHLIGTVNQDTGSGTKSFVLTTPGGYMFTAYCNCSFPSDNPKLYFSLNWQ